MPSAGRLAFRQELDDPVTPLRCGALGAPCVNLPLRTPETQARAVVAVLGASEVMHCPFISLPLHEDRRKLTLQLLALLGAFAGDHIAILQECGEPFQCLALPLLLHFRLFE